MLPLEIFVDASLSWGISVVFDGRWQAWKWCAPWTGEGQEIGGAETVALEFAIRMARALNFHNCHLKIRSDNKGTLGAFAKGRGRNQPTNRSLIRIHEILDLLSIVITTTFISTKDNPADLFSRGEAFTSPLPRINVSFALPDELVPYLKLAPSGICSFPNMVGLPPKSG
jgi:hypothetical protein